MIIKVTDNGIGREMAAKIASHGTQQGLTIIRSLIEIYNSRNKEKVSLGYIDLPIIENGKPCGTSAILSIPKSYNYELR
jgi:hypothetical protein